MTDSIIRVDSRELRIHRPDHFKGKVGGEDSVYLSLQDKNLPESFINIIVPGQEFVDAVIEQFKDG